MMSITTSQRLLTIILIIWVLTIGRSIIIMLGGEKLFERMGKGGKTAYYPILNLFTMLDIVGLSEYLGILLFVPCINLIILILMSIKYSKIANQNLIVSIGIILLPALFYPISFSHINVSDQRENNLFSGVDNSKSNYIIDDKIDTETNINLISQEELNRLNQQNEQYDEKTQIDSIFKGRYDEKVFEAPKPYKATRNQNRLTNELQVQKKEYESLEKELENSKIEYDSLEKEFDNGIDTPKIERNSLNQNNYANTGDNINNNLNNKSNDIDFVDLDENKSNDIDFVDLDENKSNDIDFVDLDENKSNDIDFVDLDDNKSNDIDFVDLGDTTNNKDIEVIDL